MKKFTSLMIASSLLVPGIAVAREAQQFKTLVGQESAPVQSVQKASVNQGKLQERVAKTMKASKKPHKTIATNDPIYSVPEGNAVSYSRSGGAYYAFWGYVFGANYQGMATEVVECEGGDVYIKNIISQYPTNTYLKGHKDGNSYVFDLPQTLYVEDYYGDIYTYDVNVLQWYEEDPEEGGWFYTANSEEAAEVGLPEIENKFVINIEEDGSLTYEPTGDDIIGLTSEESWTGYGEVYSTWTIFTDSLQSAPEGIETTEMAVTYGDSGHFAEVGFDGDNVWVKGLFPSAPNSWIVGTLDGDKVSFKSGQYVGIDESYGYYTYFVGAEHSLVWDDYYEEYADDYTYLDELVFDYDAEANKFTTGEESCAVYNAAKDEMYYLTVYQSPVIEKQPADISKVPANPTDLSLTIGSDTYLSFNLSMFNVDGDLLNTNNLYYKVFVDGEEFTFYTDEYEALEEDITLIPYNFTDNWDIYASGAAHTVYFYLEGMEEVGVQLYYYDDKFDCEAASDLVTISADLSKVNEIDNQAQAVAIKYYNMAGQEVRNATNGIFVKTVKYADGTQKSFKVVKK